MEVKAANLELDKDRVLDPALNTLAEAMQAMAPRGIPPSPPQEGEPCPPSVGCIRVTPAWGGRLGGGRAGGGGREM